MKDEPEGNDAPCRLVAARIQMGRFFLVGSQPKGLVKRGFYARLRHPGYLFASLIIVGLSLAAARPHLLAILLALMPLQGVRARKEEKLLQERFGDAYRESRHHTWF